MRYITSIYKDIHGSYIVNGSVGRKVFIFYTKREAMKEYNKLAKGVVA